MGKNHLAKIAYLVLIVFMGGFSCLRISPIDTGYPIGGTTKVMVYGFLTPADSVEVYIQLPAALNLQNPKIRATLSSNAGNILLKQAAKNPLIYAAAQKDFAIVAGQTYVLQIEIAGLATVKAQTTVPNEKAVWQNLKMYAINTGYATISGTWAKIQQGHYGVLLRPSSDPYTVNGLNVSNDGITDIGASMSFKRELFNPEGKVVKAVLLSRDINYQKYSELYDLSYANMETLSSPEFPDIISAFKGQIPSFSNVENGTGVLGSFLREEQDVNF